MMKLSRLKLSDNGKAPDQKPQDGIYTTLFKPKEPGLYQIHIKAKFQIKKQKITRETIRTFYFPGK
jgi:hypothetical protein